MLVPGAIAFVNFPEKTRQRVLHPARVVAHRQPRLVLTCEEPELPVAPGLGFRLYYELRRHFMQQAARIEDVVGSDESVCVPPASAELKERVPAPPDEPATSGPSIVVTPLGEPVSAESRQCYRVSTVVAGLKADVDDEPGCALTDVSACGFSVIAFKIFKLGTVHRVSIRHDGRTYTGHGAVQSIKDLGAGRTRYGFLCADLSEKQRTPLKSGLQQISASIQRQQLRRLAGTA
jgi:hypothetical protein